MLSRVLTLDEAGDAASGWGEPLGDLPHPARRAPGAQRREQPLAGSSRPLRDDLHPAVGEVGRVPDQAQLQRPSPGPPAKPDTLYLTMNPDRHPHRLLCGHISMMAGTNLTQFWAPPGGTPWEACTKRVSTTGATNGCGRSHARDGLDRHAPLFVGGTL